MRKFKEENTTIKEEKKLYDYSTPELKQVIGDFENIFNSHCTGEVIHNDILGFEFEGIIAYCQLVGAIKFKPSEVGIDDSWCVCLPEYEDWKKKYNSMKELQIRREYAQMKQQEANLALTNNQIIIQQWKTKIIQN